jgi:thiol-disulfide isomerase/thioredoxin
MEVEKVKAFVSELVADKKKLMLIVFVVALFLGAGYFVYRKYVVKELDNAGYVHNKEFENKDQNDNPSADLYYFYTEWCPHCKDATPVWEEFKQTIGGGEVNNHKVNFYEVNCEKDTDLANKFKIESYPTIKMVLGNQIIEYDAKPNVETLTQFLQTTLKKN